MLGGDTTYKEMASSDMIPENLKNHQQRSRKPPISSIDHDAEADDCFIFEAEEAWKEYHRALYQFYEGKELCDVTLKVRRMPPFVCE